MVKIVIFLLLHSFFLCKVYGLWGVIIYEEIEICGEKEERAGVFEFSELEIFAESDEHVYLNGTWKFLKEIKSPWKSHVFTERKIRGKWSTEILNKKIPDFCEVIQRPTEPWYHVTSKFEHKDCPFPAGVRYDGLGIKMAHSSLLSMKNGEIIQFHTLHLNIAT